MNKPQTFVSALAIATALALLPACSQRVVVKQKLGAIIGKQIDLQKARIIWEKIQAGTATAAEIENYNKAVDAVVVKLAGKTMPNWGDETMTLNTLRGRIVVQLDPDKKGGLDLRNHDHMYVSDFTRIKKGLSRIVSTEGVGATLALCTPPSEIDPFIAPEGLWRPATAVLEFNGDANHAKLIIYDPLKQPKISANNQTVPLATDFSIPLATGFALRDKQLFHLPAMLHFEKFENKLGLIRLTPFDPQKTPCVLVHGLKSSPATWKEALNKILANPALREKYEFWNYGYPTGAPIPYSAMRLRRDIAKMHEFRTSRGASDQNLLVIGHSMGGLLTKSLLQTSGDDNWNRVFTKPIGSLNLSTPNRELLRDMLYFDPVPSVSRVVFISTPHQGADLATNPISALASTLIDLPQQLVNVSTELIHISHNSLTPLGRKIAAKPPTSLDGLRTDSPMLLLMKKSPIKPDAICHTIIGIERGFRSPKEKWSDGVVPYRSASLEKATSELLVPHANHSVHRTPAGIAEIERILCLHIGVPVPTDVAKTLAELEKPQSSVTSQ